jgi:hypothetical protein
MQYVLKMSILVYQTTRRHIFLSLSKYATISQVRPLSLPSIYFYTRPRTNSVGLVRERTIPTERPPLVDEIRANFAWSAQRIPTIVFSVSRPKPLLFLPSSSSIVLTRLSGPRSRPTTSQKICYHRESNTRPLDL